MEAPVVGRSVPEQEAKEVKTEEFDIEEAVFFCISRGIPSDFILDYDDGLDFETFQRLFFYMKRRDIEKFRDQISATYYGAASVFDSSAHKKIIKTFDDQLGKIKRREGDMRDDAGEQQYNRARVHDQLRRLGQALGLKKAKR